jgi:hypothetical protein
MNDLPKPTSDTHRNLKRSNRLNQVSADLDVGRLPGKLEGHRGLVRPTRVLNLSVLALALALAMPIVHADEGAKHRFVIDQEKVTGRADGQVIEVVAIYGIRDGPIVRITFLR